MICAWRVGLIATAFLVTELSAQTVPTYADFGIGGTACCLVSDGHGGNWVVGTWRQSTIADAGSAVRVVHLGSSGNTIGIWSFGNTTPLRPGLDAATGAALDSAGNLIVVGRTQSGLLPTKGPQFTNPAATDTTSDAFVLRIDPNGNILSSSIISGLVLNAAGDDSLPVLLTTGSDGSIYIAGTGIPASFPATNVAYGPKPLSNSTDLYAFVTKLTPRADAIIWSAMIGGTGETNPTGIAVSPAGQVTLAGFTNASDFPVTQSLAAPCLNCVAPQSPATASFLTRLNANGASLAWSVFTGSGISTTGMAVDSAGNVVIAGTTESNGISTTSGAWQQATPGFIEPAAFAMKIDATATAVKAATLLGTYTGTAWTTVTPVIDATGRVIVYGAMGGNTLSNIEPGSASDFVTTLSGDLTQPISTFQAPAGTTDAQVLLAPQFTVLGSSGSILQLPSGAPAAAALLGVANAGGWRVSPQVSPGEFITLYGAFPGVMTAAGSLGGVQVLFDGTPAPLLYTSTSQINAVVPFEVVGRAATKMQVVLPSGPLPAVTLPVENTTPEILAITHSDGSPVTTNHPIRQTEVVQIWVDGAGVYQPPLATGEIVPALNPPPAPVLPVQLLASGTPVAVKSVMAAPGDIAGLLELNVELSPASFGLQVQVGDTLSDFFDPGFGLRP